MGYNLASLIFEILDHSLQPGYTASQPARYGIQGLMVTRSLNPCDQRRGPTRDFATLHKTR